MVSEMRWYFCLFIKQIKKRLLFVAIWKMRISIENTQRYSSRYGCVCVIDGVLSGVHVLCDTPPLKLIRAIQLSRVHSSHEKREAVPVHCSHSLFCQRTIIRICFFLLTASETTGIAASNKGDTNSFLLSLWMSLTISAIEFCCCCCIARALSSHRGLSHREACTC